MVYRGTVNTAIIRPLEIFKPAAQINATAIVVSHNHSSGDPSPSPEDVAVTRTLYQASRILGVDFLDHIVVGKNRWVSLKERGLGFECYNSCAKSMCRIIISLVAAYIVG